MENIIRITDNETFADIVYKLTVLGMAFRAQQVGIGEWVITVTGY